MICHSLLAADCSWFLIVIYDWTEGRDAAVGDSVSVDEEKSLLMK